MSGSMVDFSEISTAADSVDLMTNITDAVSNAVHIIQVDAGFVAGELNLYSGDSFTDSTGLLSSVIDNKGNANSTANSGSGWHTTAINAYKNLTEAEIVFLNSSGSPVSLNTESNFTADTHYLPLVASTALSDLNSSVETLINNFSTAIAITADGNTGDTFNHTGVESTASKDTPIENVKNMLNITGLFESDGLSADQLRKNLFESDNFLDIPRNERISLAELYATTGLYNNGNEEDEFLMDNLRKDYEKFAHYTSTSTVPYRGLINIENDSIKFRSLDATTQHWVTSNAVLHIGTDNANSNDKVVFEADNVNFKNNVTFNNKNSVTTFESSAVSFEHGSVDFTSTSVNFNTANVCFDDTSNVTFRSDITIENVFSTKHLSGSNAIVELSSAIITGVSTSAIHPDNDDHVATVENIITISNALIQSAKNGAVLNEHHIPYGGVNDERTSSAQLMYFEKFQVLQVGKIDASKSTATGIVLTGSVRCHSDRRLKENIEDLDVDMFMTEVAKIVPQKYNFKGNTEQRYGFIAQDIPESLKELVRTDENGMLSLNYVELVAIIPSLCKRAKALEEKL
jgi:hypothetical protein